MHILMRQLPTTGLIGRDLVDKREVAKQVNACKKWCRDRGLVWFEAPADQAAPSEKPVRGANPAAKKVLTLLHMQAKNSLVDSKASLPIVMDLVEQAHNKSIDIKGQVY
jgi:hypothetical protein